MNQFGKLKIKLKNLEKLKTNLSKYHYPDSLIKTRISEGPFNITKSKNLKSCQIKTSCHSLQHLIQITLILIVLLSPQLIA